MLDSNSAGTTLTLRRVFPAPRERVFRAWTDPAELKQWFHVQEGWSTPIAEVDLRVGGKYRIGMQPPNGDPHIVTGTYREIVIPRKLVYTWQLEGPEGLGPTVVTVEFYDQGASTEIVLTQEFFPDMKTGEEHSQGWDGCLQQLELLLKTG